jgi:hypothetical protein
MRMAALAVFDDIERAGGIIPHLDREAGHAAAETFRQCHEENPHVQPADAVDLVRRASKLAAWLQGLR